MSKLAMGVLTNNRPFLRVMKNNADDPRTVPSSDTGKFYFNSDNEKLGYIRDIIKWTPDFAAFPPGSGAHYLPAGSNKDTCDWYVYSLSGTGGNPVQIVTLYPSYFGLAYMPLCETRFSDGTTFPGPTVNITSGEVSSRGQIYSKGGYASGTGGSGSGSFATTRIGMSFTMQQTGVLSSMLLTVFNLPMHENATPSYVGTPVSGQEVVRISKDGMARIALAGYDVYDGDVNHFIMHENKIPAKMLRSGDLTLGQGASTNIVCPMDVTPTTYMDFHVKRTSEGTFFQPPLITSIAAQALSLTYTVSGKNVTVTNTSNSDVNIRYAIFADSDADHTTGGKKILLKGNDGTQDFIQIKRPGSSDVAPNLNDIMVDTRLAYFPILAEGFLSWPGDFPEVTSDYRGERAAAINFNNPDNLLPMVKAGIIFDNNPSNAAAQPKSVWSEHGIMVNAGGTWTGRATSRSVWAEMFGSSAIKFYAAGGNPYTVIASSGAVAYYDAQVIGLRYYIFGLPQSL